MSIKFKLALPILAGMVLIILLIQFFWQPRQLENAKITYEKHTHELLDLGEAGIIPHLLKRDLGSLFSSIEQLEKSYRGRWFNVTLYNENNKKIYPLFRDNEEATVQGENIIHVNYPLIIGGTNLGYLELEADWGKEKII